jgi:GNAT superfamily N-acetyltransferase
VVEIQRADESHVEAIGVLWWEFLQFHQDIDRIFIADRNSIAGFKNDHLRPHMASEDGLVLVALEETVPVGFSISEIRRVRPGLKREPYGYVDTMAVTWERRRQGIGEKMFGHIIGWLQLKGVQRVELGMDARNIAANEFWREMGFTTYRHEMYKSIQPRDHSLKPDR